ncbi:MAG: aspartyl protease family protein [Bacteroidota bacterium]|nr:aspartyl protease family protein [Bacteroidota bacterium]
MKRTAVLTAMIALVFAGTAFAQSVYGEMTLTREDGYLLAETVMPAGNTAWFAVDLAVATTAVSKAYAGDAQIQKLQSSADPLSRPRFHSALGGFGLSAEIVGKATLGSMKVGGLEFADASVVVLDDMPAIAGKPIAGVFGTDMLRRAEIALFTFGDSPRLMLKSRARINVRDAIECPMNLVQGFVMAAGTLNGQKADFLFDTGSPVSYIPLKTVRSTGAAALPGSTREITTLDGRSVKVRDAEPGAITIGDAEFEDVPLHIGELPVFGTLPETSVPVLLGNDFFARMQSVQFNFTENSIRMLAE